MSDLNRALKDSRVSLETIQSILQRSPHLITDDSIFMDAFYHCVSLPVIQHMVERRVKAEPHVEWDGWLSSYGTTCLHMAVSYRASLLPVVQYLVERWPEALQREDQYIGLPLHEACPYRANIETITYVVVSWPHTLLQAKDGRRGNLPLHVACCSYCDAAIVVLLMEHWPNAVQVTGKYGYIPLHLALFNTSFVVLQRLVQAWPEAVRIPDDHGLLPVHRLLGGCNHRHVALPEIKLLVEAWPESLHVQTKSGKLPLHMACSNGTIPLDIIRYLIDSYAAAVRVRDNDGHLPIHVACQCQNNNNLPIMECLIRAWPESARMTCPMLGRKRSNESL